MQLPAENRHRRLCPFQRGCTASTVSVDPVLRLEESSGHCLPPTLKKLLHLRALFEIPLLHVFGFPLILRHQVSAAACCACCSSCCCCGVCATVNTPHISSSQHSIVATTANTATVDTINTTCVAVKNIRTDSSHSTITGVNPTGNSFNIYDAPFTCIATRATTAVTETECRAGFGRTHTYHTSMIPCSAIRGCSCCTGRHISSNGGSHLHQQAGETTTRPVRQNKKRLRLVGEDTVAPVVAGAVSQYHRSMRTQDERAVEIYITRNVLRQIKLPVDVGSYVLFFTTDWLQYIERYIRACQRQALAFLNQSHCCPACGGVSEQNDTSVEESGIVRSYDASSRRSNSSTASISSNKSSYNESTKSDDKTGDTVASATERTITYCRCGHRVETGLDDIAGPSSSSSFPAGYSPYRTFSTDCDVCSTKYVADTQKPTTNAPLRFTPVLRQDAVQTEDSSPQCSIDTSHSSRKKVLLNLPEKLGQQLRDVLHMQVLNLHTQTRLDKRIVEEVLRNYLRAWHQRRREAVQFLRELLQRAEELLQELSKELAVCIEEKPRKCHQEAVHTGEVLGEKKILHTHMPAAYAVGTNDVEKSHQGEHGIAPLVKREEERNTVEMEREAFQVNTVARENVKTTSENIKNSSDNDSNNTNNDHSNTVECGQNSASEQAADGVSTGNYSDEVLSLVKSETGSSTSAYTGVREEFHIGNQCKSTLHKDANEPERTQGQQGVVDLVRNNALIKEVKSMRNFLQKGCEAATEVFTLQENFAARAAFKERKVTLRNSGAGAQLHGGEADGTEAAHTGNGNEHTGRQQKEEPGRKMVRIKKDKNGEIGLQTGNRRAKKSKEGEQNREYTGKFEVEGPEPPGASSANNIVVSLREKIRCAAGTMQLLMEGDKNLLSGAGIHLGPPRVAGEESRRLYSCSPGESRRLEACAITFTAPLRSSATASSARGASAVTHTLHGCKDRTYMQQPQIMRGKGGKDGNHQGKDMQPSVPFATLLQQQVEQILLLLYEPPLLCSRAGSNAVSLAVPQQGLLVRWLQDGRKEILSSIRRRRFKEVLWVDIERRGLLKSGLGSRMTLLDLKGIGEVESTQTAAGEVVRLAEKAEMQR